MPTTRLQQAAKLEQGLPVTPPQQLDNKRKNAGRANRKNPVSLSDTNAASANAVFNFAPPPSAPTFPVDEASEAPVVSAAPAATSPIPQVGPSVSQVGPDASQVGPNVSQAGPDVSQAGPSLTQAGPSLPQAGPSMLKPPTSGRAFRRHALDRVVVGPDMPEAVPSIKEGSGALHLRAPSLNGGRPLTFSIPSKELANLFDFLTAKYPVVEIDVLTQHVIDAAPKLTVNAGTKRQASEPLEGSRPARRVRKLGNGELGKVATLSRQPHLGKYYYLPKQGDPTHSQKYRMVVPPQNLDDPTYRSKVPLYDYRGRYSSDTYGSVFLPVQDSDDDTDLDTELDAASSSFKENVPSEQEKLQSPPRAASIAADTPEEGARDGQGNAAGSEIPREDQNPEVPPARELQVPETPRTRWTLGTIVNSAVKFIPGLGRVPEAQLVPTAPPTVAATVGAAVAQAPTTPQQPSSHTQRPLPQTEPRHTLQPEISQETSSSSRPQPASAHVPHAKGRSRVREENERLNVRRRAEKMQKRKNLAEELEAKRRQLDEEERELQQKRTQLVLQEETLQQKASMANKPRPDSGLVWRHTSKIRAEKAAKEAALFSGPQGPYPTGSRIAEARAAQKAERRKNSPKIIPGPAGGGYGMNEAYFELDSSDDEATTTNADAPGRDSNYPVGDPHRAQPALGSYFQRPATKPELHGGNVFRDADADEETAARAAKVKELAAKQPPRTPSGDIITNLSGHFTVPDDSDSDEGEDSDVATSTPAPQRSVKESLSEMSIFRRDNLSRSNGFKEQPKRGPPDPNARLSKDSIWRRIHLPGRTEILPPLPPTPSPAHAKLPEPTVPSEKGTPTFGPKKPLQGILKGTRKAQPPAPTVEDSESLKVARAKALQHAPRQPSNLRESHLIASSPQALEQTAAEPPIPEASTARSPSPTIAEASSSAAAAKESNTIAEDENDTVDTPPYDPEEEIMYHGMKTKRKVADHIESNWTEEDEEWAIQDVMDGYKEFMKTYVPPASGFTPRVDAWLKSPAVEQAVEEDSTEIAADIEKSLARGFAV